MMIPPSPLKCISALGQGVVRVVLGNDGASHYFSYPLVNSIESGNEVTLDAINKNNEK
jgi:hypothetical protein